MTLLRSYPRPSRSASSSAMASIFRGRPAARFVSMRAARSRQAIVNPNASSSMTLESSFEGPPAGDLPKQIEVPQSRGEREVESAADGFQVELERQSRRGATQVGAIRGKRSDESFQVVGSAK